MLFSINTYASLGTQEINFVSKSSGRTSVGEIYYPSLCKVEKIKMPKFMPKLSKGRIGSSISKAEYFTFMNECSNLGFRITPDLYASDKKKAKVHTLVLDKINNNFLLGYIFIAAIKYDLR